jgi:hypothetical protein
MQDERFGRFASAHDYGEDGLTEGPAFGQLLFVRCRNRYSRQHVFLVGHVAETQTLRTSRMESVEERDFIEARDGSWRGR